MNRKNLSNAAYEEYSGFADIKFYLSKRRFAWESVGDSWYNPQGIVEKIANMYWCFGMYSSVAGNIHVNLPAIYRAQKKGHDWRGFDAETVDEAVEYILEHEALHSAIRQHSKTEYQKQENEFKEKWRNSNRLGKLKIFYSSVIYGFGGGVPWNEEWILKQLQDTRMSQQELQRIKEHVVPVSTSEPDSE